MKEKKFIWNRDRISALVLLALSIFILATAQSIKPVLGNTTSNDPGSKLFPTIIGVIMVICSIGKFIVSNQPDNTVFLKGKEGWLRVAKILLILSAYIFVLPYLGYWISTIAAAVVLVFAMKGENRFNWITALLFGVILTAVMYGMFGLILKVRLPMGQIFTMWR